jgi:signal transduction histidine kinase
VKTIEELRQMLTVLRASGARAQELTPQFTLADLDDLVDQSELVVDLEVDVPDDLPPSVQRTVYRAVQEGISNAGRYAPGASVRVRCIVEDGNLVLTVENGPSSRPPAAVPSTRHGHIGLTERAEILGGRFDAGPTPDRGYEIRMVVPLG